MPSTLSRRDLLARTTTLAALGATGALAGCTELDVLGGSETAFRAELRRWLPAPEALPEGNSGPGQLFENYYFGGFDQAAIRSQSKRLSASTSRQYEPLLEALGLSPADLALSIQMGFFPTVLGIDHDPEAIAATLDGKQFGTVGGFRLLRGRLDVAGSAGDAAASQSERVLATDGTYLVSLPADDWEADVRSLAETLVRTRAGDEPRYVAENRDLAALFERADDVVGLNGRTTERVAESDASPTSGRFAGTVASGTGFGIDGDELIVRRLFVYADAEAVDRSTIDEYVAAQESVENGFLDLEHRRTEVDGRVAEVVMATPLTAVPTPGPTSPAP